MAKVMSYQDEEYEASNANAPSNSRGHEPRGSIQQNQDEQITTLNLAGLSVLMYKKKGEIIYRLADNMSVNSLSNEQREKLLREIKALHDSSSKGPTKMINDLSLRSTRRYNKTGRYSKKRSVMDEEESTYNQSYTQSYYTQPIPMNPTGTYYPSVTNVTNINMTNVTNSTNAATLASRLTMPSYYSGMHSINSTIPQGVKRSYSVTDKERTERTMEEYQHHADVVQRFDAAIKADQMSVIQPDYKTPFRSYQDAVARLLPYHIFDYPDEDMKNNDQTTELDSTKIALKFYKKRKVVFDKYNEIIKREAEKPCSIALTNLCERLVNEDYRTSNNVLKEEGRCII
ncbi:5443_t:CDS:2 [Diversispora eburnea]|uniref:5443_t:CDS:1 n=1 Tax=Diversispora eburnea TaxID=1213867 RepID=A0A9N9A5Z9_9GLOM|nr:5443_t:CDS:2 [Diversispora eburnea]